MCSTRLVKCSLKVFHAPFQQGEVQMPTICCPTNSLGSSYMLQQQGDIWQRHKGFKQRKHWIFLFTFSTMLNLMGNGGERLLCTLHTQICRSEFRTWLGGKLLSILHFSNYFFSDRFDIKCHSWNIAFWSLGCCVESSSILLLFCRNGGNKR